MTASVRLKHWALLLVAVVAVTTACADGSSRSAPSPTTRRPSASRVRLVSSPGERRAECVAAANELGFAVPCPTEEPATAGRPIACTLARTITATPCVGMEGLPAYRVFALEFSGFDVPSRYVGVDGKAIGHIVIEARSHSDSPPVPCIGATRLGTVDVGDRMSRGTSRVGNTSECYSRWFNEGRLGMSYAL